MKDLPKIVLNRIEELKLDIEMRKRNNKDKDCSILESSLDINRAILSVLTEDERRKNYNLLRSLHKRNRQ